MTRRRPLFKLDMLDAARRERDFRARGAAVARREGGSEAARGCKGAASMLEANEEGPLAAGEEESGDLSMDMGDESMREKEGRMRSGVRGVDGLPWTWSQQSSQTRPGRIGEVGDS